MYLWLCCCSCAFHFHDRLNIKMKRYDKLPFEVCPWRHTTHLLLCMGVGVCVLCVRRGVYAQVICCRVSRLTLVNLPGHDCISKKVRRRVQNKQTDIGTGEYFIQLLTKKQTKKTTKRSNKRLKRICVCVCVCFLQC